MKQKDPHFLINSFLVKQALRDLQKKRWVSALPSLEAWIYVSSVGSFAKQLIVLIKTGR